MASVVYIPPTPGPQKTSAIYEGDIRSRFAGVICIHKDAIQNSLEEYFSDYDHWEPYSETKSYSKRPYQAAYKGTMKNYHNYICIINDDGKEDYYVISKHIKGELEILEPFCQCFTCSACVINPLKYIWCPNCTRCLKAGPGFADKKYIEKAKILKYAHEHKTVSKYSKYKQIFENIGTQKLLEAGFMGAATILVLCFIAKYLY